MPLSTAVNQSRSALRNAKIIRFYVKKLYQKLPIPVTALLRAG